MNKLSLRDAIRRALLGLSAAAAGTLLQGGALAQEQDPAQAGAGAPTVLEEV
jgi:hypothetical protein